jgi:hypothetical protein
MAMTPVVRLSVLRVGPSISFFDHFVAGIGQAIRAIPIFTK